VSQTSLFPSQVIAEYPLVGPQLGIWLAEQLSQAENSFCVAQYVAIQGGLDITLLQQAIGLGLSEADTVHSQYYLAEDAPGQRIPSVPVAFDSIPSACMFDFSGDLDANNKAQNIMALDIQQAKNASESTQLYRHILIKMPSQNASPSWLWYQRYHHLMVDGFSFTAIAKRISQLYSALAQEKALPPTSFTSYADVIAEYLAYASSPKYGLDRDFWMNYAAGLPSPLNLSRTVGKLINPDNRVIRHAVTSGAMGPILATPACQGLSAVDLAIATVFMYLAKVTQSHHIATGFPFMRRMGSAALTSTGCVVNVLPLQLTLSDKMSLVDITRGLAWEIRKLRKHQNYEAEQIKRDLGLVGSHEGLFGPSINCKLFDYRLDFAGNLGTTHQLATGPIDDIEFGLYLRNDSLTIELAANGHRYSVDELALHGERLQYLLSQLAQDPLCSLGELSLLGSTEMQMLQGWQSGVHQDKELYPASILALLHQQGERRGQDIALVCGDTRLSFKQLTERVNHLSHRLLALGVDEQSIVATALPRSVESIVSIFAILQLGAAYLPLDLSHPDDRLKMICDDASPTLVLSHSEVSQRLPKTVKIVCVDHAILMQEGGTHAGVQAGVLAGILQEVGTARQHLAYIFYTSGSTGKPKGVMVPHGALVNLMMALQQDQYAAAIQAKNLAANGQLRVALTGSFSFDTSWDPILQMVLGHSLYLFDEDIKRDTYALIDAVTSNKIDSLAVAPSLATQLMEAGLMAGPGHKPVLINICGEAVSPALWRSLQQYPALHAFNIYGPTEFTVYATSAKITSDADLPHIGRPLANTQTYVLDHKLTPVPVGVTGSLYLAGDNMTLGYLNRPEGTASRFIANPFVLGSVMYLTGDLVRWDHQGQLEFVGRSDNQVKIRGHRIELGDVEAALSALQNVKEVAVLTQATAQGARLLGYCTVQSALGVTNEADFTQQLQGQLAQVLPDYMVPSHIIVLDSFPLTVSGKLDKKALPAPVIESAITSAPPVTALEIILCSLIAGILGLKQQGLDYIGLDDDFFNLAGDSIGAMQLSIKLNRQGYILKPRDIFSQRTPRKMLKMLSSLRPENDISATSVPEVISLTSARGNVQLTQSEQEQLETQYGKNFTVLPLLPLQQGLLFHAQMQSNASYSFTTRLDLSGKIDSARLRTALDAVLDTYPQLAVIFDTQIKDIPLQLIANSSVSEQRNHNSWPWQETDLRGLNAQGGGIETAQAEAVHALEMIESQRNFNRIINEQQGSVLAHGHLIQLGDEHFVLLLTAHHLIIDGWSTPILLRDLLLAYRKGKTALIAPEIDYAQVVSALSQRELQPTRELWQQAMASVAPSIVFENNRVTQSTMAEVSELTHSLSVRFSEQLAKTCQQQGLTLNTVMQGVWGILLAAMLGRNDVVFGSPVSGRFSPIQGLDQHIGLFSNTLPVRVQFKPEQALVTQLIALQQNQIELLEHSGLGLGEIQRLCAVDTLFDTLLVVENYPVSESLLDHEAGDIHLNSVQNRGFTHYPLTILVLPGERTRILFEYRDCVLEPELIAQRFIGLLEQFVASPFTPVCELSLQTDAEQGVIAAINQTQKTLECDDQVHPLTLKWLLRRQAQKTPTQSALRDNTQELDYQSLQRKVEQLAESLRSQGVKQGDIVAVALPRSIALSVAIQGIIAAEAAYLPLDISYPDDRLQFMICDAKPRLIITHQLEAERFEGLSQIEDFESPVPTLLVERLMSEHLPAGAVMDPQSSTLNADSPAYLIYTSGSTGRPKGVLVSHGAIINRLAWMQAQYPLCSDDVVMQKTPSSFDVSVWEFFWPLLEGASLYMAPPEAHKDPQQLLQLIDEHKITTLHFVPSMLAALLGHTQSLVQDMASQKVSSLGTNKPLFGTSLRRVFCSGEALSIALAKDFGRYFSAPLHNLYGPTEAAVDVTYFPVEALFPPELSDISPQDTRSEMTHSSTEVPIGKPVWNTQLRVLDHQLREVGIGVSGELYLCGVQLAQGYLHRPTLTAERFVANPFSAGQRMYRTGDIVRWLPTGELDYLGRSDDQLKIRGQRIEIGEIEQLLQQLEGVKRAAVHARVIGKASLNHTGGDQRQLVGYVQGCEPNVLLDSGSLLAKLSLTLPAHMMPSVLIQVEHFPLSANGKLDRKALPDPQTQTANTGRMPEAGIETEIATAFAKLLGVEDIRAEDNFFNLGGYSLLAMQLAAELRRKLQLAVSVGQIMVSPTVAQLARVLSDETLRGNPDNAGFGHILPIRQGQGRPLFCINPGSGFSWQYTGLPKHLTGNWPIVGLQSPRPEGAVAVSENMAQAVDHYFGLLKQVQAQGPYHLLGYSFGGTVAMALASKLTVLGEQVNFVGLLDTYPPEGQEWKRPTKEEAMAEVEREKRQFLSAGEGEFADVSSREEQNKMFNDIIANYDDTVRLLSQATTAEYRGRVALIVAEKSLPVGWDVEGSWAPFIAELVPYRLPFSHDDILSPESLMEVGPLLNNLLANLTSLTIQD
jgi:amino acid adenylation domain-containing protein